MVEMIALLRLLERPEAMLVMINSKAYQYIDTRAFEMGCSILVFGQTCVILSQQICQYITQSPVVTSELQPHDYRLQGEIT